MTRKGTHKYSDDLILSRETQELRSLWDITQALYQYLNIDDLISQIIKRIREMMKVETMSVALHDETKNELVFCWSGDIQTEAAKPEGVRFPADQGIAGSVFKNGKAELISDIASDSRHYHKIDDATKFKTEAMIAVPLKTKEKTIGVLEVLNKKKGNFDEEDLNFLVTLAPIIAMALDNARMYTELDRAYKELQLIDKGKDDLIKQTKNEVANLQREVERHYRFDRIIGNSNKMATVFKLCERVIDSEITVLIEGETGTGKELVARMIHYNGPRKTRPFVTQNCGGVPDTLLASELFGHNKGAYTGAFSDKKGLFEISHGGTVFLDEVSDMSPAMQTSLLRVLQEGEVKPLGSNQTRKVDIRVISATNKNLENEVKEGRFREDLFYRLSVFAIKLPPLRERVADIPVLADYFVRKFNKKNHRSIKGLSQKALEYMAAYAFPGNVRELENEIERSMAMTENGKLIEDSNLSEKFYRGSFEKTLGFKSHGSLKETVETLERSVLSQTLEKHNGNKTRAAKELGLSRYGLLKKLQRYGL